MRVREKAEEIPEMEKRGRGRGSVMLVGLWLVTLTTATATATATVTATATTSSVAVGVILDLDTSLGMMALDCIRMSLHDFYSLHPNFTPEIDLKIRDSRHDDLTAASAAWDLINNEKVHAILGPQNSEQARFVVELGDQAQVPIIWFPSSGPSLLPPQSQFFTDNIESSCFQFKAIAAIIEAFNWQSVIPIYEDPEFGNDLIPCLTYALEDMDTRVPYVSAIDPRSKDENIAQELKNLKEMPAYVFLVHMTVDLWSKLVGLANQEGMMSEGYAWILTQRLSSQIDPDARHIKYMHGTLGVKPMVVSNETYNMSLSVYGLWAYDTITALATAVEEAGIVNSNFSRTNSSNESKVDLASRGMYDTGPKLRNAILATNFSGRSGVFNLKQGQLEPSDVVVYNVMEQIESNIGYWSPKTGLVQDFGVVGESTRKYKLKEQIWPGNTTEYPGKLKVGVPKTHLTEFVNVDNLRQDTNNGFAIDVFKKVVDVLPFPLSYEFKLLPNESEEQTPWTYDDLLLQIKDKKLDVDVVIGDITIVANRTECVDFTLPYLDSRVSMVVMVRPDSKSRWILFEPFNGLLWLILSGTVVGATIVVIISEKAKNNDESKFKEMLFNPFLIYMSDIKDLASNTSRWMVIVITFLLIIVVQVYTANLTSILTEKTMPHPPSLLKDIQEIKRKNLMVGYQENSWVRGFLIEQIGFEESRLKAYALQDYYKALSDDKIGVAAIFDETPYLMLFLSKYNSSCKMAGPFYKTGGFAFGFSKNSSLVSYFSKAILNVTQNITTFHDLKANISLPTTIDNSEYKSAVERRSLRIEDFGGLFPVVVFVLSLFLSLSILESICDHSIDKNFSSFVEWLGFKTN